MAPQAKTEHNKQQANSTKNQHTNKLSDKETHKQTSRQTDTDTRRSTSSYQVRRWVGKRWRSAEPTWERPMLIFGTRTKD